MKEPILIRTVIQRTNFAEVKINNISQGQFQKGLVILFGVGFSAEDKNMVYELGSWAPRNENYQYILADIICYIKYHFKPLILTLCIRNHSFALSK